jgi:hypothetical protein
VQGLLDWTNDNFPTYFDEETLFKVMRPLLEAGLTEAEAQHAINEMQNSGLYFREKKPNATDVAVGSTPNG